MMMNKLIFIISLLLLFDLSLSGLILHQQQQQELENESSLSPTLGCSLYGYGDKVLSLNFTPSSMNPILPPGVCLTHLEYNQDSCCTYNQSLILQSNMLNAMSIFNRCPACMTNVWDLWCASSCSPYQSTFMVVTETSKGVDDRVTVVAADFFVDPSYAQGLYNSCRDVQTDGNIPFSYEFPDYYSFFHGIFGLNPDFTINWIFNDTIGYKSNLPPAQCKDSCSCESCRDLCVIPTDLNGFNMINQSLIPSTYFFNHLVEGEMIWAILSYYIFILSMFTCICLWYIVKIFKGFRYTVAPLILFLTAILLPVLAGVHPSHMATSTCVYSMPFNTVWDCQFAIGIAVTCCTIVIFFILLSILLYRNYKRRSHHHHQQASGNPVLLLYIPNLNDLSFMQRQFYRLGRLVASRPLSTILICVCFTAICSIGIIFLEIEKDPVKLWVSPTSRTALEKDYFDQYFGPFYRIEQIISIPIIQPNNSNSTTFITLDYIKELCRLELYLMNLSTSPSALNNNNPITLNQLCFQPTKKGCLIESITGIWQRNLDTIESQPNITESFLDCLATPLDVGCMDATGAPINPSVVLGGWSNNAPVAAKAFVTTFLLNNPPLQQSMAMQWEELWLEAVQQYNNNQSRLFNLAYSSERSIQDELSRESSADIPTIALSYSIMFIYVSLALGRFKSKKGGSILNYFVNTKFSLGMGGIIVVAFSIFIAIGICSMLGIKATLIISEVIPFLVLAIGVDNIFILVNTFDTIQYQQSLDHSNVSSFIDPKTSTRDEIIHKISMAMAKVGPSMALASISESMAFLLGTLTKMPAVVAFAWYASIAIFFDFLLQITLFTSLLTLDAFRATSKRLDCLPCFKISNNDLDNIDTFYNNFINDQELDQDEKDLLDEQQSLNHQNNEDEIIQQPLINDIGLLSASTSYLSIRKRQNEGLLKRLFEDYYAPFIMHPVVRIIVVVLFVGIFLVSVCLSFQLKLGLDQRIALPTDSYLQNYFQEMNEYLEVGPPFYIVIKEGYNYTGTLSQNSLCTVGGCSNTSLLNVFNNVPFVHPGISSWLDDYLSWSTDMGCCYVYSNNDTLCDVGVADNCVPCFNGSSSRPTPTQFNQFLPDFLEYEPNGFCSVTGMAYNKDINISTTNNINSIVASRFDGYHTTLKTQDDFINALKAAYYVVDNVEPINTLPVFVYSVFYVYFEQYLSIRWIATLEILLALAGVLVVTLVVLANPLVSLIVVMCVAMVTVDLLGVMVLWQVSLNAVSVVNIVMAIGISIEFCVHIAHSFIHAPCSHSTSTKVARAKYAISQIGSSIISGIFMTKLLGVSILAFAHSEIFRVYYFRMYISIVILGALHGLILLPILLSFLGSSKLSFFKR